ncbi:MAG: indolepyruvate ferredoxin oxidoreductase family protein [Steroidobacteraceae bacterium]|nr:indolepyruvate ferredoxin oxidoreductase family protein [Steroidobacteraceae bacterium]
MQHALADVSLDDKYTLAHGRVLLSGNQALVRLLLLQRQLDVASGLNTAGFVSGYRGSPLGGFDMELWANKARLEESHVVFQPGVNEDLAATAIWGTQQAVLQPGAKYDGVFSIWYGKGPGVDRSGDVLKHGNRQGAAPHGGVLVAMGDDHPGKSSTVSHQSEQALAAHHIPVLYPSSVQEILEYGLAGWSLSRYSGLWVGLKCVNETVEGTATVDVDPRRFSFVRPQIELPPGGLNVNPRPMVVREADERLVVRHRIPAAQAWARANSIDRVLVEGERRRLGIVTSGKAAVDVRQALAALGIDERRARDLGLRVYKIGMIWPLEPEGLRQFATGHEELLFVEEKAPFVEDQAAKILYHLREGERPRLAGKRDDRGEALLPPDVQLDFATVALAIARRLAALGLEDDALRQRVALLQARLHRAQDTAPGPATRTPYFCSGCPHNTSTRIPEGSLALAGIGCHTMASGMNRRTLMPTQMGGEGLNWTGIAPFTTLPHVFQNLGDGTYFHSGLLAVRGAVAAGASITYKLLYNDAVAMTGGQPVEGHLSVAEIARQLLAERVRRVVLVSDDPEKFRTPSAGIPAGVTIHHRSELDAVQRELRTVRGVTALIYEQTCAAEKRRRRKRGEFPDPPKRAYINAAVCEGCGDCSVQSNCVSVQPKETEFGRKREIDQSSCNKDYSCVNGLCPSFVTVHGGQLRKPQAATLGAGLFTALPAAPTAEIRDSWNVLVAGVGGTGVVTVGSVLAMAAHLEGKRASVIDMTGLAQKNGAVWSHLRIGEGDDALPGARVGLAEADLLLGCDLVTAAEKDSVLTLDPGRSRAVINAYVQPTAAFQLNPDLRIDTDAELRPIRAGVAADRLHGIDATTISLRLLGNTIGANFFLVGYALQAGGLPVRLESVERALELNGQAVEFNKRALALGRLAAHDPAAIARELEKLAPIQVIPPAQTLDALIERRAAFLADYQDAAYAERYRALVQKVRDAERLRCGSRSSLAEAVARYYFKLLAYKDEYEVARLYTSDDFHRQLEATFEGDYTLRFNLAPPLFSKVDPATGRPRKRAFGAWMQGAFRVLAKLKGLRGTPFNPFGYGVDRRLERQLIAEYEARIAEILAHLDAGTHSVAIEIASLPEHIRGYGVVKAEHVKAVRAREPQLLARLHGETAQSEAA